MVVNWGVQEDGYQCGVFSALHVELRLRECWGGVAFRPATTVEAVHRRSFLQSVLARAPPPVVVPRVAAHEVPAAVAPTVVEPGIPAVVAPEIPAAAEPAVEAPEIPAVVAPDVPGAVSRVVDGVIYSEV